MSIQGLFTDHLPLFLGDDGETDVYQCDGLINGIANGVALAMGIASSAESLCASAHLDSYVWDPGENK